MEVNETRELVRCQVIQAAFTFLPGPSSVSWAVRDWVPAKVIWVSVAHAPSTVQFSCSVVSNSLRPHESQHTRPPCPSPTPGVHSDSCPSSQWCHPAISSSVIPFSSCPQSLPASESFPMSQLLKPLLMWCPTLFLLYFLFVWRATKGEIWFPVWHGGKPSTTHEHTLELWVRKKFTLHRSSLYFRTFILQQLLLPSLTYLFYGKYYLHSSSNCILRTTFIRLKSNVL